MSEEGLIIIAFSIVGIWFFGLISIFVNNIIYLKELKKLLGLLKDRCPDVWKKLGQPEGLLNISPASILTIKRFLKSPTSISDPQVLNSIKRVKMHLNIGIIGFIILALPILVGGLIASAGRLFH